MGRTCLQAFFLRCKRPPPPRNQITLVVHRFLNRSSLEFLNEFPVRKRQEREKITEYLLSSMAPSICLQFPAVSDNSERRSSTASSADGGGVSAVRRCRQLGVRRLATITTRCHGSTPRGGALVAAVSSSVGAAVRRRGPVRRECCAPFFLVLADRRRTYYARRSRFWPTLARTLSPRGSLPFCLSPPADSPRRKRQLLLRPGRSAMSAGPGSLPPWWPSFTGARGNSFLRPGISRAWSAGDEPMSSPSLSARNYNGVVRGEGPQVFWTLYPDIWCPFSLLPNCFRFVVVRLLF